MCKSEFVLTSDDVNLGTFLDSLRKAILKSNSFVDAGRTSFVIISRSDFDRLNTILNSTFE